MDGSTQLSVLAEDQFLASQPKGEGISEGNDGNRVRSFDELSRLQPAKSKSRAPKYITSTQLQSGARAVTVRVPQHGPLPPLIKVELQI